MTRKEAIKILVKSFTALPKADRDRLEYHRQNATPICCREYAAYWHRFGAG